MITNSHRYLFVLAIVFSFLLFLPVVNCTNDEIKDLSIEQKIRRTTTRKNHLYDIFKNEKLNGNNYQDEEEIQHLIEEFIKNYPHRRALSFHAMRGKRSIKPD
jgi:hypothetical protein